MATTANYLVTQLRQRLRAALQGAVSPGTTTNTVVRRNVVVSRNVGQEGSTHSAVAAQAAPIRQKGSGGRKEGDLA